MNEYSKTLYRDLPLTQWSVIKKLITQWDKKLHTDDFHSYEAQYLTMLALIVNHAKLNKKILTEFKQYLPARLLASLQLVNQTTFLYEPKQKRYNIGMIINNLIYYFKNAPSTTTPRLAHFSLFYEVEIMPLWTPIYEESLAY